MILEEIYQTTNFLLTQHFRRNLPNNKFSSYPAAQSTMKILPYDTFTILAPESLPIVLQRLNAKVEPVKAFRFSKKHAPYQGTISEEGFQISRIIHHRNSFLPMIRGRFEVQSHQTLVHVKMSIHTFVKVFLVCWFCFWYSAVIPITLVGAMPYHMTAIFVVMPMLMLIILGLAFWSEANRSRRELSQIIQGEVNRSRRELSQIIQGEV